MRIFIAAIGTALWLGAGNQPCAEAHGFGGVRAGAVAGPHGAAAGSARFGAATGPYGGVRAGGAQTRSYVGPGGTTVQAGRVGGVHQGPLGGVQAGGAKGVRVTTPGGNTYTSGSRAGLATGPAGGVRAGAAHGAVATGPYGAVGGAYRGGVAIGPHGGVRAGGAWVGGTRYYSPATLHAQGAYVRGGYAYRYFTPTWYRTHPVAWVPPRWRVPNIWLPPVWGSVALFCGISAPPVIYDYGSNVVIENNYVYVDGDQVASADQYAAQAVQYADVGRQAQPAEDQEWQPLGVFGMVQPDEKVAQHIFQLALDKAGIIRGNYYNAIADNNLPVFGSVDRKTQRAAWSIGDKKDIVFETGLNNLTQNETTLLVHYGKERTQQMLLVRLEEPTEETK